MDEEVYAGKELKDLLRDIVTNNESRKKSIIEFVKLYMEFMQKDSGNIVLLGPYVKELLDTDVKNDELLVKVATIVQRKMNSGKKTDESFGELSEKEKEELLKARDDAPELPAPVEKTLKQLMDKT